MTNSNEIPKSEELIRKAECSQCGGSRNCNILAKHSEWYSDDYFNNCVDWYLLKCRGCEQVFVQTVSTNSEDIDGYEDVNGETKLLYNEKIEYWPALSKRDQPDWLIGGFIDSDNSDVSRLAASLAELYGALNNDLNMLAAIGIRTTFDVAAELLNIDSGQPFKAKLEVLEKTGHIGKVDRSRLETLVDAGSASAHRGWRPDNKELSTMMDVLEHFIYEAFVAPKRWDNTIDKMKSRIPARNASAK